MLDRLSIRSKIAVILIVPVLACATLGALRVSSRISTSRQANRVSGLTEFSLGGTRLAHELQLERGLSARYLDEPKNASPARAMVAQRPNTDRALGAFRKRVDDLDVAALAASTKAKLASALGRLSSLPELRREVEERAIAASGALGFYNATIADVLNANRELAGRITDRELAQSVGAFVDLSRIRELAALERDLISGVLAKAGFEPGQYRNFTSMLATRAVLLSEFRASATPAQRALYAQTVVGPEVQRASELENAVVASEGGRKLDIEPEQWWKVTTADLRLMHAVEQGFGGAAIARSKAIERSANSRAAGDSLVVLAALALAVGLSLLVARSMLRPLRLLEATAKDVASNRLPGVVAKLQRSPTQQSLHLAEELEPVEVPSRDEIGEVATAFNAVHQVALRVAAEQAALRTSIGEMFLNLARRSQTLIDRQIELIDDLEEEADARTLGNLFQLDHLATRMRRNAENLIVLSGAEPPRRWVEPIPLPEIVRGAVAEVEDYQRVALVPIEEIGVPGHAVADVIHLLAELIENATSFSPPGTTVQVGGQRSASGYVLEIEDRGLGMSDDELMRANQRLADPPAIDFAVSRMLGLFVVGRLAQRYGIRVQLRRSSYGGVTALVMLPSKILIQLSPEPVALPSEPSQLTEAAAVPLQPPRQQPAHAERLPIFEQARSEWFASNVGAEHGPPQHHAAYPPLAARYHVPTQQPSHGQQRPPSPPEGAPATTPPPRPSRAVDEPPRRVRNGFASASAPPAPTPEPAPKVVEVVQTEAVEVTPLPPFPVPQDAAVRLPRRVPRANLAPGILEQRRPAAGGQPVDPAQRQRSPEEVRSLLATYRAGLERGRRTAASGETTRWPPAGPESPPRFGGEDDGAR
ncbi:MAG TPA: nitrate- and nitrite sensing domain-containing protein [Actinomycetes bacterium]|nr:nitrate- and nitrite sensing domain-containing protein [Actinomycetes bacterium]